MALACSGGVDSTALLVLACEALRRRKVAPFVVLHVDHRTRAESAIEGDAVRELSRHFGVPFVQLTLEGSDSEPGRSLEDFWRERRYRELGRAAHVLGIRTVVTAHTQDDQVETVLMRVFSGSQPGGMTLQTQLAPAGMELTVLRPLLGASRHELDEVLRMARISPIIDPSNLDTTFRRNAVRHELVPALQAVFPGFERALLRSVNLSGSDAEYCDLVAAGRYSLLRRTVPDGIALDRQELRGLHRAISSRVIRLAALDLIGGGEERRELTFERIEAVMRAADGRSGALIELPYDISVFVEHDRVVLTRKMKGVAVG